MVKVWLILDLGKDVQSVHILITYVFLKKFLCSYPVALWLQNTINEYI